MSRIAKKTVCVVAPVHIWDDVRVYHKEARTLAHADYRVIVIARAPRREIIDGVEILPARTAISSRFLRLVALPRSLSRPKKILIRSWIPADLRHLPAHIVVLLKRFVSSIANGTIVTQRGLMGRFDRSTVLIGNPPRLEPALFSRVAELAADLRTDYDGLRAIYLGDINAARGLLASPQLTCRGEWERFTETGCWALPRFIRSPS